MFTRRALALPGRSRKHAGLGAHSQAVAYLMIGRPGARTRPLLRLRRLTPELEMLIIEEPSSVELSGCPAPQQSTCLDIVEDLPNRFPLSRWYARIQSGVLGLEARLPMDDTHTASPCLRPVSPHSSVQALPLKLHRGQVRVRNLYTYPLWRYRGISHASGFAGEIYCIREP